MPMDGVWKPRDDSKQVEMVPGVRRQVLAQGATSLIVRISIAKGAEVPMHTHFHEQTGHIASGKFRFTIGGETRDLGPGDGYAIPPHVPHGGVAIEDDTVAVDVFNPVREEYVEP